MSKRLRRDVGTLIPLILVLASLSAPRASGAAPATTQTAHRTLFAAGFQNETGDEQYDAAAAGMGDLIVAMLGHNAQITVVERQKLLAISQEQALSLRGLTAPAYAVRAGQILKADTLMTGRLYLTGPDLAVAVKVMDIATERLEAADQFTCRPQNLPEGALQTARQISGQMGWPLPAVNLSQIDASPIASLHFGKALSHYYTGNMDAAAMEFMRTCDLDPDFNDAHYFCGLCFAKLGENGHACIEWETFLERQPDSPRARQVEKLLADAKQAAASENVAPMAPSPRK